MIHVVFGTNEQWISKLIRWATRGEYSHAWLEYPSMVWGGRWAAHATEQGVVKEKAERVYARYPKRVAYTIDTYDLTNGVRAVSDLIGDRYDFMAVIWNAILLVLWRSTGWQFLWRHVYRNASRQSCSEFVARALRASGIPWMQDVDPELVPPPMLRKILIDSGEVTELPDG